ncbi:MAG: replicative DNA helicase [Planctomycetes bacterium]|nr:replicative DNA helicase [Planctomycetota bacterium]
MGKATENPLEGIPPHDESAEAGVLGSMLCDERAAGAAVELLVPEDFYVPRHQLLFDLFRDLYDKHPDLDPLLVQSALEKRGLLERVGGKEIVGRLIEETPNAANVERYCRIVRERAEERELIQGAGQIIRLCKGLDDSGEGSLVERAEELIFKIADRRVANEPVTIQSVLEEVVDEAERHISARRCGQSVELPALPTGFADLDKKLAGGLWPGEVIIVAARPSVGKTTLAINIARRIACRPPEKKPQAVAIFSLEMRKEQISKNILCGEARISSSKMRTYQFDEEDYVVVKSAVQNLQNAPIFIDDTPGISPSELRARARRLYHRENVRLLVIDYLQLMTLSKRTDTREQAVAEMSRQVKQIARELDIPVILLSQLRRPIQGQESRKPELSDLRESGSIEQDADVVLLLHREADEADETRYGNVTDVIVKKNRNGETGMVRLSFIGDQLRFENYEPDFESSGIPAGI